MATYTATVALDRPVPYSVSPSIAIVSGRITLSPYSQTKAAITAITGLFKGTFTLVPGGISSLGWATFWDPTNNWIQAFAPNGNAAAQTEAPEGTNVGVITFLAFGLYN